jgi:hypothetical protein
MSRELRRLQDTKEFSHIDERPVIQSVWSNGKFVDPKAPTPQSKKKPEPEPATEEPKEAEPELISRPRKRRVKKFLDKGLYAGQDAPIDISKGLTVTEKKSLAQLPELIPSGRVNRTMPMPMFNGLRLLIDGRDFKLPYQVCNPLPPGQPKPDEWKKMTKSEFNNKITRADANISQIGSLVNLRTTGESRPTSMITLPSVSVSQKMAAERAVKTESCCMNVMNRTATLASSIAPIVHLPL